MTRVLLIRHPESVWNRLGIYQGRMDIPLSSLGTVQADLVAARLQHEQVAGILCSPLLRALALAESIARHHETAPEPREDLTEISHGEWEGMSRQEVREHWPEMYRIWTERPHAVTFPGGESLQDVHNRAVGTVAELLDRDVDQTWVVVTHDTVVRLVVAAAQGRPVEGFTQVSLENAAITTLEGPHLLGSLCHVNDVEHLGEHRVDLEAQAL